MLVVEHHEQRWPTRAKAYSCAVLLIARVDGIEASEPASSEQDRGAGLLMSGDRAHTTAIHMQHELHKGATCIKQHKGPLGQEQETGIAHEQQ
jgi:hypothetical protein